MMWAQPINLRLNDPLYNCNICGNINVSEIFHEIKYYFDCTINGD